MLLSIDSDAATTLARAQTDVTATGTAARKHHGARTPAIFWIG